MTEQGRRYTVDEFERLIAQPEHADRRLELIDGEIIERAMPTEEHGQIVDNVSLPIRLYLKSHHVGRSGPEIRYRAQDDPHNDLIPDWSFRLNPDQPLVTQGPVPQMPDFALEVQSPDDKLADLRAKARTYLRLGVKLVWLILPRQRVVEVYWANGEEEVYTVEDTLGFGDLLAGFTLPVRDIFDL